MSKALFVGRFQPFHLGHHFAIEEILKKNDHVIIIIGSAREHDTTENPFSVEERIEMIKDSLLASGVKNFEINSLEDFHDDRLWTSAILRAYKFDVAYSQNMWTLGCFRKSGVKARKHRLYQKKKYSGVHIRELIAEGKQWKHLVPEEVYGYIRKISGEERVKKLNREKSK